MNGIPSPPPGWWGTVPWQGYFGLIVVIAFLAGPFGYRWLQGRATSTVEREKRLAQREARSYSLLEKERDELRERLASVEADRDEGWDRARGAEVLMHQKDHDLRGMIEQRNSAYALLKRLAAGTLRPDVATELSLEHPSVEMPPPLPKLRSIERKKPGETKYA